MARKQPKKASAILCGCGCGQPVKWNKSKKDWNKFIYHHQNKGKNHPNHGKDKYKEEKSKIPPLCQCGCKQPVKWNNFTHKWNRFIVKHQNKGNNNPSCKLENRKNHYMKKPEWREKMKGDNNPARRTEVRKLLSENNPRGMLNKHHSIETRKKISKNHRDISGCNNPMKDPKQIQRMIKNNPVKNDIVKNKISKSLKGRFTGDKNPSWKGGISCEPYCDVWLDQDYKQSIKDRDNNTCQNPDCWHTCDELSLTIHHIDYNKKNCIPKNLITLCLSCNSRANGNKNFTRNYWQNFYQSIMKEKYNFIYE